MTDSRSRCSLIVVNFNGRHFLPTCFGALHQLDYARELVDLIMIDNGSRDDSIAYVNDTFPAVRTVSNTTNNFASALNLGIQLAHGEYIGFINTDAQLDPQWLSILVDHLNTHPQVGAAGGKIYLRDGRINSVGHRMLPHYYWEDMGCGEVDTGQYDTMRDVEGLCWAAVLFRRSCLHHVGPIDTDFVMYFEDVDYAKRCRLMGWTLSYIPLALAHHSHGGSGHSALTTFFCNRNRFLYLAKHAPEDLAPAIDTSVFWRQQQYAHLYQSLLIALTKLIRLHPAATVAAVLPAMAQRLLPIYGQQKLDYLFMRIQVTAGTRRPALAIAGDALRENGSRQHELVRLASVLQDRFDITLLVYPPLTLAALASGYDVDLSHCRLEYLASSAPKDDMIRGQSAHYDIFLTASALAPQNLLSPISLLVQYDAHTHRQRPIDVDNTIVVRVHYHETDLQLQQRVQRAPELVWSLPSHRSLHFETYVNELFDAIYQMYANIALPDPAQAEREPIIVSFFRRLNRIVYKRQIHW